MQRLTSALCRILFIGAFVLSGLALWEKVANFLGYTLLGSSYTPWRLLEFSVVALLFVIALELRQIRESTRTKDPNVAKVEDAADSRRQG